MALTQAELEAAAAEARDVSAASPEQSVTMDGVSYTFRDPNVVDSYATRVADRGFRRSNRAVVKLRLNPRGS